MLLWTIKIAVLSLLLIYLVHYLFCFFTDMLTIPKVKDLVNTPAKEYDDMFKIIGANTTFDSTSIDLLPTESTPTQMKDELKNFMKKQLGGDQEPEALFTNDFLNNDVNANSIISF
jgi:hypothetical protein